MKIRYIVLEMENEIRYELENMLDIYNFMECVGSFSDIVEASSYMENHEVDVVFVDYDAGDPARSGDASFMCHFWKQQCPDRMTVLFGKDAAMAYHCLRQECFDFFPFPASPEEILRVVNHIRDQYTLLQYKIQSRNRILLIHTKDGYQLMEKDQILFVERSNRKNRLVTSDGREMILAGYTMDELEQLLSACGFYRCYQSFIVNPEKITSIRVNSEKKVYTLHFDEYEGEIILSREKYSEILELMKDKYAKVSL